MTQLLKIYKPFDVIVIPFPFSDKLELKKRPALVLSSEDFNRKSSHLVTAMITSTELNWPYDTRIRDLDQTGLKTSCIIRLKFFTVDQSLVLKKIGCLSEKDQALFRKQFRKAIQI